MRVLPRLLLCASSILLYACALEESGRGSFDPPSAFPSAVGSPGVSGSASPKPSASPAIFPKIDARPRRLVIPRLLIDLPIADGDGVSDLGERTAWRLKGTALLGQGSNTFLYSHARAGSFLLLWDALLEDEVQVFFEDGSIAEYRISRIVPIVQATDLRWVIPTRAEQMTLQTSTGTAPELPKFIVIAQRIK